MEPSLNPGNRPRKAAIVALGALAVAALLTGAAVLATPDRADASGLQAFSSCQALQEWGVDAMTGPMGGLSQRQIVEASSDVAVAGGAASSAATTAKAALDGPAPAAGAPGALGATNVVVDGVDELDLIDHLDGDRVLVVAGSTLAIVDLGAAKVVARHQVPLGAQVTYDGEAGRAWAVGTSADGMSVSVQRIAVGTDDLQTVGSWSTPGQLVDARRVGGRLHLVATDAFRVVAEGASARTPFAGGPVPCDQVLHPAGTSDANATLIVTLPVEGALRPVHAAEVVGAGQLVHVTTAAAYLATPQWSGDGAATTTIHRFDLASLTHTGSGTVPGTLLNDYSMSDDDGHLRVAITADPATEMVDGIGSGADGGSASDGAEAVPPTPTVAPMAASTSTASTSSTSTVPTTSTTSTSAPSSTSTSTSTTSTTAPSSTSTTTSTTSTTAPSAPVTIPGPQPGDPLNKVVVLDTDGDLDVVGATPWFGHPRERLEGIRFDGDRAYAVTYLNTDPFYVLDLSSPTDPKVAGELQLPGFSSYLHPIGHHQVVGFGPGDDGRVSAKLFDVSDPSRPVLQDSLALGDSSPVTSDHHAFTDLGDGRFAVPVTTWSSDEVPPCAIPPDAPVGPAVDYGCAPSATVGPVPCRAPVNGNCTGPVGIESQAVEIRVAGSQLRDVEWVTARLPEQASRVIPVRGDGGWALLGGTGIAIVGHDGTTRATIDLG
ncbi:beta-propeller domain-containing protein [Aquihabitans sp. McL0605]|uniref:beta-propeller domain-containing protein n=1 Tax=Aquihabitans sp. McL0605 TaxID=3415671 RepID=UPI003CFAF6E3